MSAGSLVLGLLLALVLAPDGSEFVPFGWGIAALGAVGVVLHLVLPSARKGRGD